MIQDSELEASLNYLSETDERYGTAKARVDYLSHKLKILEAKETLNASGTGQERKAKALTSEDYLATMDEYKDAVFDRDILYAKRSTASAKIEIWRTISANRRKGAF